MYSLATPPVPPQHLAPRRMSSPRSMQSALPPFLWNKPQRPTPPTGSFGAGDGGSGRKKELGASEVEGEPQSPEGRFNIRLIFLDDIADFPDMFTYNPISSNVKHQKRIEKEKRTAPTKSSNLPVG